MAWLRAGRSVGAALLALRCLAQEPAPAPVSGSQEPAPQTLTSAAAKPEASADSPSSVPPAAAPGSPASGPASSSSSSSSSKTESSPRTTDVNYRGLASQTALFLGMSHAFRVATEPGTREGMKGPWFDNYARSITSMHGWSDGDPFLVNYIGHPMQGAVAGYIWASNDPKYYRVQFGMNRDYWRSRARATAYSFFYSAQFEIGPFSEASIGAIQQKYPAYGFVDHVITPVVGLGWMTMEDALDRFVIRWLEGKTDNKAWRLLARGGLNPARSFANVLAFRVPWHRYDREGVGFGYGRPHAEAPALPVPPKRSDKPWENRAPLEIGTGMRVSQFTDSNAQSTTCVGSGVSTAWNLGESWGWLFDVGFCKPMGFGEHLTGDSLTYMMGPRWRYRGAGRFVPRLEFLMGGQKVTQDLKDVEKREAIRATRPDGKLLNEDYFKFTQKWVDHNLTLAVGGGLDVIVSNVVTLQLADFRYQRAWLDPINGFGYRNQYQFSLGANLRVGSW